MSRLFLCIETDTLADLAGAAMALDLLPQAPPMGHLHGFDPWTPDTDWVLEGLAQSWTNFAVYWETAGITVFSRRLVHIVTDWEIAVPDLVRGVSALGFEVLSSAGLTCQYDGPSFSDGHRPHGWVAAFQGRGHDRVVSRRWLDHGPWATLKGPNDTTWVLFFDPEADEADQEARARAGHQRMGISDTGGFLQTDFAYTEDVEGLYDADLERLRKVVHGGSVTQRQLLELCAVRRYQALGPDRPVQRLALVFMTEDQARPHVHELWLRGIECWAIVQGREVRLDLDHTPPPKPDWAIAVEQRYQGAI